jgi:hypothetical protein
VFELVKVKLLQLALDAYYKLKEDQNNIKEEGDKKFNIIMKRR